MALRERRMRVTKVDFSTAREKVEWFIPQSFLYAYDFPRSYTGRTRVSRKAYTCNFLLVSTPVSPDWTEVNWTAVKRMVVEQRVILHVKCLSLSLVRTPFRVSTNLSILTL